MDRRAFISGVTLGLLAAPLAAEAQPPEEIVRIGVIGGDPANPVPAQIYRALLAELRELGFSEGKNLIVDFRSVRQDSPEPFAVATELVRSKANLLLAVGPEWALQATVNASRTIPIVMVAINFDPLARGYVSSLAQPGGNITGLFYRLPEMAGKQVELLTQAFPKRTRLAVFWEAVSADQFEAAKLRAESLRLELYGLKLGKPPYDFNTAFRVLTQSAPQMLLVLSGPQFTEHRFRIAKLAIQHRLPTMFTFRTYVEAGGFMSYGIDNEKMGRRAASYVVKILNGRKPSDLPVEQPTEFELAINLKTAKSLGLTVPQALLQRADQVIE